jgi:tryptophanyl-tRNA synthetase
MVELPRRKRILSGIKPTGIQHLGNYFGALRQHVDLHRDNSCVFFIADYHSMTTITDPEERRHYTLNVALDYLGLGVDPKRAILYRQSDLPETTELTWLLSTVTPHGLLERAHSYKDHVARGLPVNAGLFTYPVLMAADILIHRADLVPVGQDQKQHIEIARDIAIKFNNAYGDVLTLPDAFIPEEVAVVPGTDGQKMSKSYDNCVHMFAAEKQLRKEVMGIVTDSTPVEDPKDPDASALYQLWKLFASPEDRKEMSRRFRAGGLGYGEVKKDLNARILAHFAEARERRAGFAAQPDTVEDILRDGADRARETAGALVAQARAAAGLGSPSR